MIQELPPETLKYLLDLYNKIWKEEIVVEGQKSATITPLLMESKDLNILGVTGQKKKLITDSLALKTKSMMNYKKETVAIFFDNEKVYDNINRIKTFGQIENMRIQG